MGLLDPPLAASTRARLVNPTALRKWYAALGARRTTPVRVAVTGNSNWEGTGATDYSDRLPVVLQEHLRRAVQPAGIVGAAYPNIHLAGMSPVPANPPYTVTGSAAGSQYGLGGRGFKLVSGTSVSVPFTGDRVRVHYVRASAGGILNLVLDGGAAVTIDTFTSGAQANGVWDSGALTVGAHTLVLTRDAATTAGRDGYVGDVETFNGDYTAGIRVYDHARHGVTASGLYTSQTGWSDEWAALAPWHLIVMGLGENDTARTPAQYKSDIQGLIAFHRASPRSYTGSFLLVHGPKPSDITQTVWDSFGLVEREIALSDADVACLDLTRDIPGVSDATGLGIYADTKHKNSAGQGWAADVIADVLLARP